MITDLTTKCNLSAITVTNISQSFTYKMAAKINWHRYGTIIASLSSYVFSNTIVITALRLEHCREL